MVARWAYVPEVTFESSLEIMYRYPSGKEAVFQTVKRRVRFPHGTLMENEYNIQPSYELDSPISLKYALAKSARGLCAVVGCNEKRSLSNNMIFYCDQHHKEVVDRLIESWPWNDLGL